MLANYVVFQPNVFNDARMKIPKCALSSFLNLVNLINSQLNVH